MIDSFFQLGGWAWLIAGLVLMGLELLLPGVFLIWIGLAALVTGAIVGLTGISWQIAALIFAALALPSVFIGQKLMQKPADELDPAQGLNARDRNLIGRVLRLERPIADGQGQVRIDDSLWRVAGEDLPSGTSVKVVRVEGTVLWVEKA
jgi:membrane protein implicated in regulation of membrane protease activity